MEENNRKGPGIFYAVTGVATLVVAIIGATFAFFAASATDNTNITGDIASAGGVTVVAAPVTATGTDLVPLNVTANEGKNDEGDFVDTVEQLEAALTADETCVDDNGNNVCQIYKITVKNLSTTSTITTRGYLTLAGTGSTNLKWQLLDSTYATDGAAPEYATIVPQDTRGNLTVGGNSIATVGGAIGEGTAISSNVLGAEDDIEYYVMVWLEETGTEQQDEDAEGSFLGTVFFTAVDASGDETGITASFASAL